MLPSPSMLLGNTTAQASHAGLAASPPLSRATHTTHTNHDRLLAPSSAAVARPLPSPRRRTEQLIGGTGGQFEDHTIPDGDPLPDVDDSAALLLAELSSRGHSPNTAGNAQHHSYTSAPSDKAGPSTLRPSLYDLTSETLRPHNKMQEPGQTVENWTRGPVPRHYKYVEDANKAGRKAGEHGTAAHVKAAANGKYPYPQGPIRRNEPKKEHPCSQCGRIFHSRSELRHHARRYEKRPYTCDQCDKSFLYPKDLRRHKTTHTGSKQYKCRICPKSFSRKDNLRRHINNEHDKTDVPLSPSLEGVEMPGRRRESEDSDEGGPENGHGNGYRYGEGHAAGNGQASFSMPTDVAEHSGTGSARDGAAGGTTGGGGGAATSTRGSYNGRTTQGVSSHSHNQYSFQRSNAGPQVSVMPEYDRDEEDADGEEVFESEEDEDEDDEDYEPTDGDRGHAKESGSRNTFFAKGTETAHSTTGASELSNGETNRISRRGQVEDDEDDEEGSGDQSESAKSQKKLVCPLSRWKPHVHICPKSWPTIRNLIHHLKQKHKLWFHARCTRLFTSEAMLKQHDKGAVCCRKCRTGFETVQEMGDHKSKCEWNKRSKEADWEMIYDEACGDDIEHNPFEGNDYPGAEEVAKTRYANEHKANPRRRKNNMQEIELPLPAVANEDGVEEDAEGENDVDVGPTFDEWAQLTKENKDLKVRVYNLERQTGAMPISLAQPQPSLTSIPELRVENQALRETLTSLEDTMIVANLEMMQQDETRSLTGLQDDVGSPVQYSGQQLYNQNPNQALLASFSGQFQQWNQQQHPPQYGLQQMAGQDPAVLAQFNPNAPEMPFGSANMPLQHMAPGSTPMQQRPVVQYQFPSQSHAIWLPAAQLQRATAKRRPADDSTIFPRPSKRSIPDDRSVYSENLHDQRRDFGFEGPAGAEGMDLGNPFTFSILPSSTVSSGRSRSGSVGSNRPQVQNQTRHAAFRARYVSTARHPSLGAISGQSIPTLASSGPTASTVGSEILPTAGATIGVFGDIPLIAVYPPTPVIGAAQSRQAAYHAQQQQPDASQMNMPWQAMNPSMGIPLLDASQSMAEVEQGDATPRPLPSDSATGLASMSPNKQQEAAAAEPIAGVGEGFYNLNGQYPRELGEGEFRNDAAFWQ